MADTFSASIVSHEGGSPDVGGSGSRHPAGRPVKGGGSERILTAARLNKKSVPVQTIRREGD